MRFLLYSFLICIFTLSFNTASAQLFGKKKNSASATNSSGGGTSGTTDSFKGKNKKGPNVNSPGSPGSKSKSKQYMHATSKKDVKLKNKNSEFSSTKRRYKSTTARPKNSEKDGASTSSGGRKSGKGRKKEKQ
ncbi:MAG: hypothetical protein IT232_07985 [Flavobacteriales bacterium]|nr:hypothetical protein [Flavobacteriales bacterium]